jgi:hypothetical protein
VIHVDHAGQAYLLTPAPTLLFRRFTEGIYYEVCQEPDFGAAFGNSFQSYVGAAIQRANANGAFRVYAEAEYRVGKERKDTVDWVITDHTATLFIESKTKRLRLKAKTEIRSVAALEGELDKLADFLLQLYKTIRDYQDGHYPHIPQEPSLEIYPVVLTLEDWFAFGPKIIGEIDRRLHSKLVSQGLDAQWPRQRPYSVVAVEDFEVLLQVVATVGIAPVMRKKIVDPEPRQWLIWNFLWHEFKAECRNKRNLFPEVMDEMTEGL